MSTNGGLGSLQMVSEPDTRQCASEEVEPRRGVDTRWCANKDAGPLVGWIRGSHVDWRRERVPARTLEPEGGWIVRSHIGWGGERSIVL